jgi:glycosyltransferase involved in cell wall biosynthesis
LVEAGDPKALAKKILELKADPQRCAELADKGSLFAAKNLSPEVGREKYLEWVGKLIVSK